MKVSICDCCRHRPAVDMFTMDRDGIHPPTPVRREEGLKPLRCVDLCESCSVSLAFHWGETAKR